MSIETMLTSYYPVKKAKLNTKDSEQKKQVSKISKNSTDDPDYHNFLECSKLIPKLNPNIGLLPTTPFNKENCGTWIYPGSKGFRKYQYLICRTCLFFNTLVCLPTGLGKTFIAAVVMFNYYRWFTEGLVFFLAPTKPLVDQQYNAYRETILEFNPKHVGQLTGKQNKAQREKAYKSARIFFMTPQTLANDLSQGLLDKSKITCIVFDEAHRATGNYAYCKIISQLKNAQIGFRVVALSATPGPNVESIQQILTNLCISKIEARDEEDTDVKQYTHFKDIEVIKIEKTSEINELENLMKQVVAIPQGFLQSFHFLPSTKNQSLNKMVILNSQDKLKTEAFKHNSKELSIAFSNFSSLLSLLNGLSMLLTHGMESFKAFCEKFKESAIEKKGRKQIIESEPFKKLTAYLSKMGDSKNHPKLEKMLEILHSFFQCPEHEKSQVIIFTLFVNSAQEICQYLSKDAIISAEIFIGQSNGYTQNQQMKIINNFKSHKFNTLVATCIGEEGLDIGYVDLILSYDCTGSPVRMIQRFGRTGRKQEGKVVILLCKEEEKRYIKMKKMTKQIYDVLKAYSDSTEKILITKNKFQSNNLFTFNECNPRILPDNIIPISIYAKTEKDYSVKNTEHSNISEESKENIDIFPQDILEELFKNDDLCLFPVEEKIIDQAEDLETASTISKSKDLSGEDLLQMASELFPNDSPLKNM